MRWLVDSGTTFPVKLGSGVSFRFIRNEWQWFYSNEYSSAYDEENEREVLATKQVVFIKSPLELLKVIGQHSVEDEDMWDSVYRHRGIYLTLSEAIREVQELKLQFDAQLNWLVASPFEKVDKTAYLSYLLRVAIGRIGNLRANSTEWSSLSEPLLHEPHKEAVDGDVDKAAPIQSALPLPEADIPKGGDVSDLGQPHGLPDYEVFQPVEVVFKQESVASVIREIAALGKFYADAVPPKLLDTLMPHAGFLYCRHQPFAHTDVDVLLDWLENWSKELLIHSVEQPNCSSAALKTTESQAAETNPPVDISDSATESLGNNIREPEVHPDGLSPDGRTLRWGGRLFGLSPTASRAVRLLVESYRKGYPCLHESHLKTEGEFESDMRCLVKDNGLESVVIREMKDGKRVNGKWRMADPAK